MLSKGCVLCHKGAKLVLFVTGRCTRTCWYCPISTERRGQDVVYANERRISAPVEILEEAERMQALGTGITGGEPLLDIDRVVRYCALLKDRFGPDHHIHLYTGIPPTHEQLLSLRGYVDEIRLHPPREVWQSILETAYIKAATDARSLGFSVGIEVPSLPGIGLLAKALPFLDFLNINELEWSETNADAMRGRGHDLVDSCHNAVAEAKDWAREIIGHEKVHWCSSTFKDSVQLRERLRRIAAQTARPFDEVTEDGTIVYGVLEPEGRIHPLEEGLFEIVDGHIEMAWWLLMEEAAHFPGKKYVVERYPAGGIIVEVTPL